MRVSTGRILVLACLAGFVGMGQASALDEQVVLVDLQRVFNEYDKTERAQQQIELERQDFKTELERMRAELRRMEEEFDAIRDEVQNTALSEDFREARRSEGEAKVIEIREYKSKIRGFAEDRRKQLQDQLMRMRENILQEITDVVRDYARDEGYVSVLDTSGLSLNNQTPLVVYADPKFDISDEVIAILNQDTF